MAQLRLRKRRCPVARLCALAPLHSARTGLRGGWRHGGRSGAGLAEAAAARTEDRGREAAVCRNACSEFGCDTTVNLPNSLQIKQFVQKRCNLHLVDTWNMIDSFEAMV